jgi:hypothetical protein
VYILGFVNFTGTLDVSIGGQRLLDEALHLFFVGRESLDGFQNEAVCRSTRPAGERRYARFQLRR